jgi:hypothetical protein
MLRRFAIGQTVEVSISGRIMMLKDYHYRKLENMMHSAPIVSLTGGRPVPGKETAF